MNTTHSMTHSAASDTTAQPQFAWPLPATNLPNAHVIWAEWVAQQAANISSEQYQDSTAAFQALREPQSGVSYLDHPTSHDTAARFAWPLPATKLPNAHLTWAEWLNVQANGTVARQPEQTPATRAA